jgi:Na+-driven multidrug efflux pump
MYKHREKFNFSLKLSYFRMNREDAVIILSLGLPQAARSLLVRVSMLYVNASVNAYGLVESATNSVGNKLQKFLEVYTTSFSQAASAMVAQNLGARKHDRASKTVLYSFGSCMFLAALTAILIVVFPKAVFGVFTKDPAVLDMGVVYLQILVLHLFLSALTSTFQSMIIGSGYASLNFVIGVLDGVVCKVGLGILLAQVFSMGVYGYWWGTSLSRLLPGLICVGYFAGGKWKTRKLLTESGKGRNLTKGRKKNAA